MRTTTVHTAMAEAEREAATLLDRIDTAMHDLPAPETDGLNWAHVGTMRAVVAQLQEIETFLLGAPHVQP